MQPIPLQISTLAVIIPDNLPWSKFIKKSLNQKQEFVFIDVIVKKFADGESTVKLNFANSKFTVGDEYAVTNFSKIPFQHCCIVYSLFPDPNNRLIELGMIVDSVKRFGIKNISVITPYFCYARQDRFTENSSCLSAKFVLDFLCNAGISELYTFDVHTESVLGYSKCPFYNTSSNKFFLAHIAKLSIFNLEKDKIVFVAPDVGSIKRCRQISKDVRCSMAIVDKERNVHTSNLSTHSITGDVAGMHCIIIDDIIDSGNTLLANVTFLKKLGAKSVIAYIAHPVLSNDAISKIDASDIDALYVTNSIELKENSKKIKVLDLGGYVRYVLCLTIQSAL